jgi:hypothetical protein
MSSPAISRSADLERLRNEGFELEVRSGYLIVKHVPYANASGEVCYGQLVSELTLAGDTTTTPNTHVIYFAGAFPCNADGSEIAQIKHSSGRQALAEGLVVDHSFSNKPSAGYRDYFEKITRYVAIIGAPAVAIDPEATARTFAAVSSEDEQSVFCYLDTASSRAQITAITAKLARGKVAIVGLGGTGSYVLDLVAKTPVREIHLFDSDVFLQHNAFRAPGAAAIETLRERPAKVDYLKTIYSRLHRGIHAHPRRIDASNLELLDGMEFVFLCLDSGAQKRAVVEALERSGTPFIDVGMGLYVDEESLTLHGTVRVTTSTPDQRAHVHEHHRIAFAEVEDEAYAHNIQIADLNALNASLAVIRWKKLWGFYGDLEHEHHSVYTINGNLVINEDQT